MTLDKRVCGRKTCELSFALNRLNKLYCSLRCSKMAMRARKEARLRKTERYRERSRAKTRRYYWRHKERYTAKQRKRQTFFNQLRLAARMEAFGLAVETTMKSESLAVLKTKAQGMATEALKNALADSLRISREHLLWQGAVVVELDRRGESVAMAEEMGHYLTMLRRIGKGELLVDVVIRFGGKPYTMTKIARLPVNEQREALLESDDEIAEHFPAAKKYQHQNDSRREAPDAVASAKFASPGDVAEMCLELIRANEDPAAVVACLTPKLQQIKTRKASYA